MAKEEAVEQEEAAAQEQEEKEKEKEKRLDTSSPRTVERCF